MTQHESEQSQVTIDEKPTDIVQLNAKRHRRSALLCRSLEMFTAMMGVSTGILALKANVEVDTELFLAGASGSCIGFSRYYAGAARPHENTSAILEAQLILDDQRAQDLEVQQAQTLEAQQALEPQQMPSSL